MAKIKIDNNLFAKIKKHASTAGYSSVEEFIAYVLEKETDQIDESETDDLVNNRLKGLGYIE